MLPAWATRRIQLSTLTAVALVDIVAGLIWIATGLRAWYWGVPDLAILLVALSTAMIVAGVLLFTHWPMMYLVAMLINALMATRMAVDSYRRIHVHIVGGFIPGYWVPQMHTVLSVGQTLLFLAVCVQLIRLYCAHRAAERIAAHEDLGAAAGWDQAGNEHFPA